MYLNIVIKKKLIYNFPHTHLNYYSFSLLLFYFIDSVGSNIKDIQEKMHDLALSAELYIAQLSERQKNIESIHHQIEQEKLLVDRENGKLQELTEDAKRDLESVLPVLEAATKALEALNKRDVSEIRSFTKPPKLVEMVMCSVCVLLGSGFDWEAAKRLTTDPHFIHRLITFDKDSIDDAMHQQLRHFTENPLFDPNEVKWNFDFIFDSPKKKFFFLNYHFMIHPYLGCKAQSSSKIIMLVGSSNGYLY